MRLYRFLVNSKFWNSLPLLVSFFSLIPNSFRHCSLHTILSYFSCSLWHSQSLTLFFLQSLLVFWYLTTFFDHHLRSCRSRVSPKFVIVYLSIHLTQRKFANLTFVMDSNTFKIKQYFVRNIGILSGTKKQR